MIACINNGAGILTAPNHQSCFTSMPLDLGAVVQDSFQQSFSDSKARSAPALV